MTGLGRVPIVIWVYAAFCVAVTVFDFGTLILGMEGIREAVIPYSGWSLSTPYMFGIIFVSMLIFGRARDRRPVWAMVAVLVIYILVGLYGITLRPEHVTSNPYLIVSPYRIVWVGIIPALWILVLRSRPVLRFAQPR